jgi:hypothetical protein
VYLEDALNFTNFWLRRDGSGNGRPLGRLLLMPKPRRRHRGAKGVGARRSILLEAGLALSIEDVDEHASCVQVDAAIVSMLLVVEPHDS